MLGDATDAESLAAGGLRWLLGLARESNGALTWTGTPGVDEIDPTLYSGSAGIVITLLEAYRHFGDDRYADAAIRGARGIAAAIDSVSHCSLYFGLTGMAVALRAVDDVLGDSAAGVAADRALQVVRSRFDGERWSDQFELLGGNAGIALGALSAGEVDLAVLAVEPYLRTAEPTSGGVHWEVRAGVPARFHHISHGTLGIVHALAAIGHAGGWDEMSELALAGAADVVSRNEAGPSGFLVPHSDPQHKPELIERYSFGWCHGPAGDARPGVPTSHGRDRGRGLAAADRPLLAHGHPLRPTAARAPRLLGQQRPLLRHRWGARTGHRPARRAARQPRLRDRTRR